MAGRQTARTRARDTDRDATCKVLDNALSEGQLTMEEHRQRVAAATSAATLGDLQSLVSDLQTTSSPVKLPNLDPDRRYPRDSTHRAGIEISIYVSPNFGNSGYIAFNGDASVKRINHPS